MTSSTPTVEDLRLFARKRAITDGARITRYREEKGIARETLAAMIGISNSSMHRIETGQTPGRLNHQAAICAALEVEPQTLFPPYTLGDISGEDA